MYPRQSYNDLAMLQNQLNQQRAFQSQQPNMPQQQQQQQQSQPQTQQASNASLLAQQIHAAAAVANQHKQQQQQSILGTGGTPLQQATQLNNPQGRSITPISLIPGSVPVPSTTSSSSVNHSLTQTPDIPPVTTATSSTNATGTTGGNTPNPTNNKALNDEMVYSYIVELAYGPNKEEALLELGKKREFYDDLALVLWNSFGVMSSLLSEIVSVYPLLSPPNLTTHASNRVCNALALLQCVASHPDTRTAFLHTQIPLFLYPFLNTSSKQRPYEYLRLTSLGVIGALVKNDTPDVIQFLLTTEIIPLCLKIMETSSELNKTVAIFIVQKILIDDAGLAYVCQTYDRFEAVSKVLSIMIEQLVTAPTARLLRHVIRCYLRLSDNPEARNALKEKLPQALKDETFANVMKEDPPSKTGLAQLLQNLQG